MKKTKAGQSAYGVATMRLVEQYQPEPVRLVNDPVIKFLLPKIIVFFSKSKALRNWFVKFSGKYSKGIYGWLMCRTRYMDDRTQAAIHAGAQQVLVLGAGLDTRAYRIDGINSVKTFEVDLSAVQEFKVKKLRQQYGALPANVKYVPIDFNSQTIDAVLKENEFDFLKQTFVIWEGVTQYITKDAAESVFAFVATLAAGSSIVFSYVLESVINEQSDIEGANELVRFIKKTKSPWMFGIDPAQITSLLKKYNLALIEDIGAGYCQKKYLQPTGRQLSTTEMERVVFAKVNG